MGDLNCKSPQFGSPMRDERGDYIIEGMSTWDPIAQNIGRTPTFVREIQHSFIDLMISTSISKNSKNRKVLGVKSLSDHHL